MELWWPGKAPFKMKRGRPPRHGFSNHMIYGCWNDMMQRCYNPKRKVYKNYGGRGITVCPQWHDPGQFIEWTINNGWKKELELDRENNNLGYHPKNCRFVTPRISANNRRSNLIVTISGKKMTFADAHQEYGRVKYETARKRFMKYGWPLMDALEKPRDNRGAHNR